MVNTNGWPTYAKLVLNELKRHSESLLSLDLQMSNHITEIEHRLTKMETTIKNLKWIVGILLVGVIGIFGMVFVMMVN